MKAGEEQVVLDVLVDVLTTNWVTSIKKDKKLKPKLKKSKLVIQPTKLQ